MNAEKEYSVKMNKFSLININDTSNVTNIFTESLYQPTRYEMSTLISDVYSLYSTGSYPLFIHSFEDTFDKIFDKYKEIVGANEVYLKPSDMSEDEKN